MRAFAHIIKRFRTDRSGSVAMEFGILAVPFFVMLFGILELSYKNMVQTELDNKLYYLASDIAKMGFDQEESADFLTEHLCDQTGTLFTQCDKLEIGVRVISTDSRLYQYRETSVIGQWDLGCAYDTLLVELNYPVENYLHPIVVADIIYRGEEKFYRSRGIIRREPLLANGATC